MPVNHAPSRIAAAVRFLSARAALCSLVLGGSIALAQDVPAQVPADPDATWTVNFRDAGIEELIRFVAEATGKTLIIDPAVQGTVQVISTKPVNATELYQLFLSILEVNGFAAIEAGDVVRVVPMSSASEMATPVNPTQRAGGGGEVITQVIQVGNVSAEQLVPVLRSLAADDVQMTAYAASNSIIVTDTAANIARIRAMIEFIDRSSVKQTQIVPLQNAAAADVVGLLQQLRGSAEIPSTAPMQIVADERTNSILLSGEQAQMQQYLPLIEQLDSPLTQDGKVNVINLQYARAESLAPLLSGILRNGATAAAPGAEGAAPAAAGGASSVEADSATNSLIITADAETLQTLKNVIARLDIRKAQVLVEAIIVELSGERGQDLGVQWLFQNDNGVYGSSSSGSPTSAAIAGAALAGEQVDVNGNAVDFRGPLAQALALTPGQLLGVGRLDDDLSFNVLISALQSEKAANILSTPSLLTLDNEEAVITVGRNVPFVTGSFTSTGNNSSNPDNPFQTVERQNVGVTLRVTPHINEGDSLVLELSQEVSSLLGAGSVLLNGNPITNERIIETTVLANDGQTVVLGGLMEDSLNQNDQRVPLLGDIPGLGRLFRNTSDSTSKTHLVVFLRASIMRENREMEAATAAKYSAIRAEQLERADGNTALPLLPEWQQQLQLLQQNDAGSTVTPSASE
ncbi:MAG: type II secretion system secretin GspD [Pseudomonadota bacterium]